MDQIANILNPGGDEGAGFFRESFPEELKSPRIANVIDRCESADLVGHGRFLMSKYHLGEQDEPAVFSLSRGFDQHPDCVETVRLELQ